MFSLIIPTYNEKKNVESFIEKVRNVLGNYEHEIIVVDDNSPDGTWQLIEALKECYPSLRLIRRISERGLSSAVLSGFQSAKGDILGVMDADHSHDVCLLPEMIELIESRHADCVIGSRRIEGGGIAKWPWHRRLYSFLATDMTKRFLGITISDPLSGFFCVSRPVYETSKERLRPLGYKILLEILVKGNPKQVLERPFIFQDRQHGVSKLLPSVIFAFFYQVLTLFAYRLGHIHRANSKESQF